MAHRVTLIPGDGTGPELTEATRRVLEATGVEFDWDVHHAGTDVMEENGGNPLPQDTLDSIRENGVALKGPITTPVGRGFRSVNVRLRLELDLHAEVAGGKRGKLVVPSRRRLRRLRDTRLRVDERHGRAGDD